MTAAAIKITIIVAEFKIDAYQLNLDGETHLLFTHRQNGLTQFGDGELRLNQGCERPFLVE